MAYQLNARGGWIIPSHTLIPCSTKIPTWSEIGEDCNIGAYCEVSIPLISGHQSGRQS